MRGIHQWPVNSPHKRPVTRQMFPFDDIIMTNTPLSIEGGSYQYELWKLYCCTYDTYKYMCHATPLYHTISYIHDIVITVNCTVGTVIAFQRLNILFTPVVFFQNQVLKDTVKQETNFNEFSGKLLVIKGILTIEMDGLVDWWNIWCIIWYT